jgi:glucose-6-phosphate isomerase
VSAQGEHAVLSLGAHDARVRARLRSMREEGFARRLWQKDATLWKSDPQHREIIANAMGWLDLPSSMAPRIDSLSALVKDCEAAGYTDTVLLGMGGSSLAPEVMRKTFGIAEGFLDLQVLDSTDPAAVLAVDHSLDLSQTVFLVSSKSGTTTETVSFAAYFCDRERRMEGRGCGRHLVAITDVDTPLAEQAERDSFRARFVNPSDVGGRYSALSLFGLVPAALIGVDLRALLESARRMATACGPEVEAEENEALVLGAALGELALAGRDKLTLVASPPIESLGAWIEQLVAESLGKEGRGILPVDLEPPGEPDVYGGDRVFVYLRLRGREAAPQERLLAELEQAGHPVITLTVDDLIDLGGEFLRWEIAVAAAGAVLGVDPFDQPNVQESKDNTRAVLRQFRRGGELPEGTAGVAGASYYAGQAGLAAALAGFLNGAARGDYLAIQAYLPPSSQTWRTLQEIRATVRDRTRTATTLGYGPRFLHSTGQYHKGGPGTGLFVQVTCEDGADVVIPGEPYTFGVLKRAQAIGDLQALRDHGRRVFHVGLGEDVAAGLERLHDAIRQGS